MGMATHEAGLRLVDEEVRDQVERGLELADRMERFGLSGHRLHNITGLARDTIKAAREGKATDRTYRVLEQALEDYELAQERGEMPPDTTEDDVDTSQFITVNLSGNFGITATVKGPVDRPEELQRMLAAILREMKSGDIGTI